MLLCLDFLFENRSIMLTTVSEELGKITNYSKFTLKRVLWNLSPKKLEAVQLIFFAEFVVKQLMKNKFQ